MHLENRVLINFNVCVFTMQIPLKKSELISNEIGDGAHIFATNISNTNFGNTVCWFWVKNKDELNNNEGCSAVVTCNPGMLLQAHNYTL